MKRLEFSLLFGLAAMLLFFFLSPTQADAWWTVAFEPLCDGILSAEGTGEALILRSKLAELCRALF